MAISTHFSAPEDAVEALFDDSKNGPLATFAAKTRLAYALGILDDTAKKEMDLLRHIRNQFAHTKEKIDFDTKEIAQACDALKLPTIWRQLTDEPRTSRYKYELTCRTLYLYLEDPTHGEPKNIKHHGWIFSGEQPSSA